MYKINKQNQNKNTSELNLYITADFRALGKVVIQLLLEGLYFRHAHYTLGQPIPQRSQPVRKEVPSGRHAC